MSTRVQTASPNYEPNLTPAGDWHWSQKTQSSSDNTMSSFWYTETDGKDRVTSSEDEVTTMVEAPSTDATARLHDLEQDLDGISANVRRNMSGRNSYKHVPHKDRPPLIVARRNARERRRVQAVNSAFTRLRKVVPIANNRGKRVSKVKTLQTAIDYIGGLQTLLKQADIYHDLDIIADFRYQDDFVQVFQQYPSEF